MRLALHSLVFLSVFAAGSAAQSQSRTFFCGEDSNLTVSIVSPTRVRVSKIEGQVMTMEKDPSKPFRFFFGDYAIEISRDQTKLKLEIPDFGTIDCIFQGGQAGAPPPPPPPPQPNFPTVSARQMPAQSWGGAVRSGPGQNFAQVGSLRERDPITLVDPARDARTPLFNGYNWFEIRWRGGRGYQWGGIICGIGEPIPGAFEVCR